MICWAATILVFVGEGAGSLGAEFSGFFQKDTHDHTKLFPQWGLFP
jgi:hypothetical protein